MKGKTRTSFPYFLQNLKNEIRCLHFMLYHSLQINSHNETVDAIVEDETTNETVDAIVEDGTSNEVTDVAEVPNETISDPISVHEVDESVPAPLLVDNSCQTGFEDIFQVDGKKTSIIDILTTDKAMSSCTGLASVSMFKALCDSVDHTVQRMNANIKLQLDVPCRVMLTLMKLKLNLSFRCLSCFFKIGEQSASRCFFLTMDILHSILKQFIVWLPLEIINDNMPIYFASFSDTRLVLDCAEIPIQTSKCVNCSVRTYSNYKGRHTVKFLLAVAPDGTIIFVSRLYGGRASDKFIVNHCKILDQCESGTAVMVDKGFDIDDECINRNLKLYRPSFFNSLNNQFTADEVDRCRTIARARVHVERTIQRIRIFKLLNSQIPWSLLHYGDKILTVACALVNLSQPILSSQRFDHST